MDRPCRKKISKAIAELSSTINHLDTMDILDYSIQEQYGKHSSQAHMEHSTKIDDILGHKTHLNKFKRIWIMQCLLSDDNGIKLEIYNRKTPEKFPKYVEIKRLTSK